MWCYSVAWSLHSKSFSTLILSYLQAPDVDGVPCGDPSLGLCQQSECLNNECIFSPDQFGAQTTLCLCGLCVGMFLITYMSLCLFALFVCLPVIYKQPTLNSLTICSLILSSSLHDSECPDPPVQCTDPNNSTTCTYCGKIYFVWSHIAYFVLLSQTNILLLIYFIIPQAAIVNSILWI